MSYLDPVASTATGAPTGDVDTGGIDSVWRVIGLYGRPVGSGAPSVGQAIAWNGTHWVPTTIAVSNTLPAGPDDNAVYYWNGATQGWEPRPDLLSASFTERVAIGTFYPETTEVGLILGTAAKIFGASGPSNLYEFGEIAGGVAQLGNTTAGSRLVGTGGAYADLAANFVVYCGVSGTWVGGGANLPTTGEIRLGKAGVLYGVTTAGANMPIVTISGTTLYIGATTSNAATAVQGDGITLTVGAEQVTGTTASGLSEDVTAKVEIGDGVTYTQPAIRRVIQVRGTSSTSPINCDLSLSAHTLTGMKVLDVKCRLLARVAGTASASGSLEFAASYALDDADAHLTRRVFQAPSDVTKNNRVSGVAPSVDMPSPPDDNTLRVTITPALTTATRFTLLWDIVAEKPPA
jgi:hypothetical protein